MIVPTAGFQVDIYSSSTPYIVLPRSRVINATSDCICPIILNHSELSYNFSTCSCFNDTLFSNSLTASNLGSGNMYQLKFSDLSGAINNTIVHLFESFRWCGRNTQVNHKLYRKYFKSFKIITCTTTSIEDPSIHTITTVTPTSTGTHINLSVIIFITLFVVSFMLNIIFMIIIVVLCIMIKLKVYYVNFATNIY